MAQNGDWEPVGAVQGEGGPAPARPRLSLLDLILQLWRAKWLMLLIFLPIFAVGMLVALQMPKLYESSSGLYVRAGDEIRIVSTLPNSDRDTSPELEQIIQGELELLRSPVVAERTLSRFPLARIYPDLARARDKALAKSPAEDSETIEFEYFQKSVEAYQKNFWASSTPKNLVINVAFKHKEPDIAAEVLNAAMATYLNYRSDLFGARPVDKLTVQRKRFEKALLESEDSIRTFLMTNGIGDFGNERSTAQGLFTVISEELLGVRSRASAIDGQSAKTRAQLTVTSPQQDMFIEDSSDQTLQNLQVEREQLLSRYTEDSRAVQNIDKQIAQVQSYLETQDSPTGLVRTGPNPTYQALETALNTYEAEAEALAMQRVELEAQLAQIEAKLTLFTRLEPEWNALQRERDLLEVNVRSLAEREQQIATIGGMTGEDAESVRVLEPARVPLRGKSLRFSVAVLALLFAGFTALVAGLLWALTRQGFASARPLRRTIGLPVIGVIGRV